jgi:hypothetical protein
MVRELGAGVGGTVMARAWGGGGLGWLFEDSRACFGFPFLGFWVQ